jgi:hypothetical protein
MTSGVFVERGLQDEILPQGQLFENWSYRDWEPSGSGYVYVQAERPSFGSGGLNEFERNIISADFPWIKILTELGISAEVISSECEYERVMDDAGGTYFEFPETYELGSNTGDKFTFVAREIGANGSSEEAERVMEWFLRHYDHAWYDKRQLRLSI